MRRALKILAWIAGLLVLVPVGVVAGVLIFANTGAGQRMIESRLPDLTGGMVHITGLSGRVPDRLRADRIELRDKDGAWLTIESLVLDWHPLRLLGGTADIELASAAHIAMPRLPVSEPSPQPQPQPASSNYGLPVTVKLNTLKVPRLDLGAPVAGVAGAFAADGSGRYVSLDDMDVTLALNRLDSPGTYELAEASVTPDAIRANLKICEPVHGFVGTLAALPDLGPLSLDANLDGPRTAIATRLALDAGQLTARADGTVDYTHSAADLAVKANAPAMAPRPDLSWQSIALDARVRGPFTAPDANGTLAIASLQAAGAAIARIDAQVRGDTAQAVLHAEANDLRIPGPKPDALAGSPLVVDGTVRLDQAARPLTLSIRHKLLSAEGTAETNGPLHATSTVEMPDLAPLAAIGGIDVRGHTNLVLTANQQPDGETIAFTANGPLAITGGMAPLPGLIGNAGALNLAGTLHGADVAVSKFALDGRTLALTADGGLHSNVADVNLRATLSDLRALAPTLAGKLKIDGKMAGPLDDFGVTADVKGEVASEGVPRGPLSAHLEAKHLPKIPAGKLTAQGALDGAPLNLAVEVAQTGAGGLKIDIPRASWKSAQAAGALTLPPGARVPLGKLDLRMSRLDDLRGLTGQPLSGSVTAALETTEKAGRQTAVLTADLRDAGLAGKATVGRAALKASVLDPLGKPSLDAKLTADGIAASGVTASGTVTVAGPQDALGARVAANVQNLQGAPLSLSSAATVDVTGSRTTLSELQAQWKGQTLRLLVPARIAYGQEVSVDRLRLGMQQATVDVAGRISPTLDLTAAIRNVTPDLARIAVPDLQADGTLNADARLTGTQARPAGTVRVAANGLRIRTGQFRSLPPASIAANAEFHGESADVDARLAAGRGTSLTVNGRVPVQPTSGPMDVRAQGSLDLALLNPILEVDGRRVRGQVTLDARAQGTAAVPQVSGTAQLANGDVQDLALGARVHDIAALIQADGTTIRIARFDGRAGPGTLGLTGTISPAAPGMPVNLRLLANNAEPLASDRLTANLSADLTVSGEIQNRLSAVGKVTINRAEIRIPEHMPASIVVLNVRRRGEPPPPPPAPGPNVALDVTVVSPGQMFVRGRGIFAELGGSLHLSGTSDNPQPQGAFNLIRGTISVAGQSLTFSRGEVSFNGGKLSDPSILFVATSSTTTMTANLEVSGTASNPKIRLYSTPEFPQDEVLAQLIFKRSASSLSPFELAQLAGALAQLTGVGGSGGFDPLNSVREGLGLDTLSVGGGTGKSGPSLTGGKYVAPGVFVGAKQGTGGTSTQGLVQVDLYRGLKLQGTVGAGTNTNPGASPEDSAGSSIGLKYQFEY